MKPKEVIEIFKRWMDYNKVNKDKINRADELIEVQETILDYIEELELQVQLRGGEYNS